MHAKPNKFWFALGDYPKELMFEKQKEWLSRRHEVGEAVKRQSDVKLTPVEALASKREVEPDYGDF